MTTSERDQTADGGDRDDDRVDRDTADERALDPESLPEFASTGDQTSDDAESTEPRDPELVDEVAAYGAGDRGGTSHLRVDAQDRELAAEEPRSAPRPEALTDGNRVGDGHELERPTPQP